MNKKLQCGDIFATPNNSLIGRLARELMEPATTRFHFGLVWRKVEGDYLILESIDKGIAVGRLSFYKGQDVRFYRVNCPAELRRIAPMKLTKWGRSKYDYLLILKIFLQGLWVFITKRRRVRAEDLSWSANSKFICTEAVDMAFKMTGVSIIPWGVCPTPSAFKQAELEGRINEII